MRKLLRRAGYLLRRRRAHDDLTEELTFHRDMTARALEARGTPPRDAAAAARRVLGNPTLAHDQVHDVWVPPALQGIGHDFRVALRTLIATPVVSVVAALSLALGIGANTAIFSLIDGLLLRALPVRDPARLVLLTDDAGENPRWSYQVWREIDQRSQLFDGTLAWSDARLNLARGGETRYVSGLRVSGSFFEVLGVQPLLGRTLSFADDMPGGGSSGPVAVISYDFWQRHFGGAPTIIGAPLSIDGTPLTIVGVTRRDFFGVDVGRAFDVAVPIRQAGSPGPISIIARLRPGATIDSATAALRAVQPQIREATLPSGWPQAFLDRYLKNALTLTPATTGASRLRARFSPPLLAVMAIVALVLVVASANLANLALARAAARRHEFGVRLALGASRLRLVRHVLAESVALASTGAALGLLIASWTARLLVRQLSTTVPSSGSGTIGRVFVDVSIDGRVLAFTMAITVITALVFGLVPALRASRVAPLDALVDRRSSGPRRRRVGPADVFIVSQVAISLIVVVAAGLFTRTLAALETRPLGFDRDGILVATVDAQRAGMDPAQRQVLYATIVDAVRQLPSVADAALSSAPPVVIGSVPGQPVKAISGEAPLPPRGAQSAVNLISPGWFHTMGIPLVAGRDVSRNDRLDTPPVVVVNEMFARTLLHGANPVGRALSLFLPGPPPPPLEIVGVVSNTVYGGLRDRIEPTIYLPIAQLGPVWARFLVPVNLSVRSSVGRPELLTRSVAAAIVAVNADVAMTAYPLSAYVNDSLVQERLIARLSGSFAVLTLLLAALGLYGVMAYATAARRREIGIRIALGAARTSIVRLALGRVFVLLAAGIIIGTVVSVWASSFLASLLYEVEPRDPAAFGGAVVILAAVACAAGWLPARRAARIDPMRVLRAD
jgi:putative ABC transport system permease protein